ncbi:hypothetical protein [Puerhibacterium puerhi]|uniref:hypothetical protein n=1 Tax=Puerhibacterium puerhi TaxID=2692623 RepID=UPI0013584F23|nr:hypothetical protein [Puerhibacterium puerhi]
MTGRNGRVVRAWVTGGALGVAAALSLGACTSDTGQGAGSAQSTEPDICASLDTLSDQVDQLGTDVPSGAPTSGPAAAVREQVADVEAALARVQAAADGNLDSAIAAMQTALTDFTTELATGTEEGRDAAQQSLDEVHQAWTSLAQGADVQCGAGASQG